MTTRQEKLSFLKNYIESFDRLPEHAFNQGVSLYEMKAIMELLYEILAHEEDTGEIFN